MSTRVIAAIGVVLCLAMTSFSIYLGVVEHSYTRGHAHTLAVAPPPERVLNCLALQPGYRTLAMSGHAATHAVSCHFATSDG
jgi:hypothetical protein